MSGFLTFIEHNMGHVAPILVAAAFALVIILERTRALVFVYPMMGISAFYEKVRNLVISGKIGEAIALCERYKSKPVAFVIREGLLRAHEPEVLIEEGLRIAVGDQQDKVQLRTSFLATIANVATLLGLFGTIIGLVQSFEAVGSASAQQRSALLAAGISTAMNATMLGLAVAIPCMIAFSFLMNKTNQLNAQIERSAMRTLEFLRQYYYSNSSRDSSGGSSQASGDRSERTGRLVVRSSGGQ